MTLEEAKVLHHSQEVFITHFELQYREAQVVDISPGEKFIRVKFEGIYPYNTPRWFPLEDLTYQTGLRRNLLS